MIALKLTETKKFMNQLLCTETFDHFLLAEAAIVKDATFTINGRITPSFYQKEELLENGLAECGILPYAKLRPICYQIIRGTHTPVRFKFIFTLSPENMANTLAKSSSGCTAHDVTGIFLNLTFQNGALTLTTGISYAVFPADHTLDREWDRLIRLFLDRYGISYKEL